MRERETNYIVKYWNDFWSDFFSLEALLRTTDQKDYEEYDDRRLG